MNISPRKRSKPIRSMENPSAVVNVLIVEAIAAIGNSLHTIPIRNPTANIMLAVSRSNDFMVNPIALVITH